MSIQLDLRVAPAPGRVLNQEKIVSLVEGLLDQDLVLPPFRLLRGAGLLDEDLGVDDLLPTLFPRRDKPPRGTKSAYDGDDTAALLAALKGCDLGGQAVSIGFGTLNWNAEKTRQGIYYPGESLVLFASPDQETTIKLTDNYPDMRTYLLSRKRKRAVEAVRYRQCLILLGGGRWPAYSAMSSRGPNCSASSRNTSGARCRCARSTPEIAPPAPRAELASHDRPLVS